MFTIPSGNIHSQARSRGFVEECALITAKLRPIRNVRGHYKELRFGCISV